MGARNEAGLGAADTKNEGAQDRGWRGGCRGSEQTKEAEEREYRIAPLWLTENCLSHDERGTCIRAHLPTLTMEENLPPEILYIFAPACNDGGFTARSPSSPATFVRDPAISTSILLCTAIQPGSCRLPGSLMRYPNIGGS